jgi:hypothetical protein
VPLPIRAIVNSVVATEWLNDPVGIGSNGTPSAVTQFDQNRSFPIYVNWSGEDSLISVTSPNSSLIITPDLYPMHVTNLCELVITKLQ